MKPDILRDIEVNTVSTELKEVQSQINGKATGIEANFALLKNIAEKVELDAVGAGNYWTVQDAIAAYQVYMDVRAQLEAKIANFEDFTQKIAELQAL